MARQQFSTQRREVTPKWNLLILDSHWLCPLNHHKAEVTAKQPTNECGWPSCTDTFCCLLPNPHPFFFLLCNVRYQLSVTPAACTTCWAQYHQWCHWLCGNNCMCQSLAYLTGPSRGHCSNMIQIKLPVMCTTDHVNVTLQHHGILNSVSLVRLSTFLWLDTTRQHHDRAGGKTESSFRLENHSQAIVQGHSTKQLTCSGENFQRW